MFALYLPLAGSSFSVKLISFTLASKARILFRYSLLFSRKRKHDVSRLLSACVVDVVGEGVGCEKTWYKKSSCFQTGKRSEGTPFSSTPFSLTCSRSTTLFPSTHATQLILQPSNNNLKETTLNNIWFFFQIAASYFESTLYSEFISTDTITSRSTEAVPLGGAR